MNKWMKQGMTGLLIGAATVTAVADAKTQTTKPCKSVICIDALDLAGGSKLKDRLLSMKNSKPTMEIVRILINS